LQKGTRLSQWEREQAEEEGKESEKMVKGRRENLRKSAKSVHDTRRLTQGTVVKAKLKGGRFLPQERGGSNQAARQKVVVTSATLTLAAVKSDR